MTTTALRVVLVGDYPADPMQGSAKALYKLSEALAGEGQEVSLLLRPELGARPRQRHARDLASPWLAHRAVAAVARAAGPPDVVDASSAEGLLVAGGFPSTALVARSHGVEHLNFARMLEDARQGLTRRGWHRRIWYPAVRMQLVAAAARRADQMIVLNAVDREFARARRWKLAEDVHVIPHGLGPAFLPPPVGGGKRGAGVLFCGSWDPVKGIDYLVSGFSIAAAQLPDLRLTVLGPGHPPERVLGLFPPRLRHRVRVVERVPEEAVIAEYRRHDMLVACSTYEGYGMVVPEAMSQRLPVIATPAGAAATLVRDGVTGLLVPVRDTAAIARAIVALAREPERGRALAEAAVARVMSMSWGETARATLAVYRRALDRRRGNLRRTA